MSDIYVGIREDTEEREREPESDLRQHVCPQCGNVDILTGNAELDKDVKPILAGDKLDEGYAHYSSSGGFTEFCYRYLPHKCTACGVRFTAVKREKAHLNKKVIAWYTLFAITVAAHIALSMLLIANDVPAWFALIAIGVPLSILYANVMIKIHDNTLDKDPGPDYICENGPSDSAFRRLEAAYEEEEEEDEEEEDLLKQQLQAHFGDPLPELLKQRLQAQPYYILQGAGPRQVYVDGKPLIFPQPTIRPWDIHPW